jgi:hypothetical protein
MAMRRFAGGSEAGASPQDSPSDLAEIRHRLEHLEKALEALQDAVHRQARHDDERFQELHRKTEPEEMARALSADARRRGI